MLIADRACLMRFQRRVVQQFWTRLHRKLPPTLLHRIAWDDAAQTLVRMRNLNIIGDLLIHDDDDAGGSDVADVRASYVNIGRCVTRYGWLRQMESRPGDAARTCSP